MMRLSAYVWPMGSMQVNLISAVQLREDRELAIAAWSIMPSLRKEPVSLRQEPGLRQVEATAVALIEQLHALDLCELARRRDSKRKGSV